MTEEIIKECKNCDALGIDSEIGVYYCCLSHRQDDLPKEFTCNDFTPDKQLKRLKQECEELKQENERLKDNNNHLQAIIDDGRAENKRFQEENKELKAYKDVNEDFKKAWDELNEKHKRYRSALENVQKMILSAWEQGKYLDGGLYECLTKEFAKINEVLNEN